jgi:hypothetical protein
MGYPEVEARGARFAGCRLLGNLLLVGTGNLETLYQVRFTPVLAKHSNKWFSLIDCISVGVDRMQRNFEPMQKQETQATAPDTTRFRRGLAAHPHQISIHYDRCGAAREVTSEACPIRLWTLFASSTTSPSPRSSKSI